MKKRKIVFLFLFVSFVLILSSCSTKSNAKLFNEALQNSSIGDSEIKYSGPEDLSWYNFKKQDKKIQECYMSYIKELGEFVENAKLEKVKKEDVDGIEVFNLKLNYNNQDYLLKEKYIYPETTYLIISVGEKTEYYFLDPVLSKQFFDIELNSDNYPFNHISLIEYFENENK